MKNGGIYFTILIILPVLWNAVFAQYPNLLKRSYMLGAGKLVDLVDITQRVKDVLGDGVDLTLFSPTDAAFDALSPAEWSVINSNETAREQLLFYQVIKNRVLTTSYKNDGLIPTLSANNRTIRTNIYKQPGGKVLYTVNGAKVLSADNDATNGIVTLVDRVFDPIPTYDVMGLIQSSHNFTTLGDFIKRAGTRISSALAKPGVTMFAPNDRAFEALPPGATYYWQHNNTALQEVLLCHILQETYYSAGIYNNSSMVNADGRTLQFQETTDGQTLVMLGRSQAKVIIKDIQVANGVVHVIDQVLVPRL